MGHGQRHSQAGVEQGGFPLDEALIVQAQGQRAKAQHQHQGDLVHGLQLAVHFVDQGGLHHGGTHQHRGGGVDVGHFVSPKKQQDGEEVDQKFHEVNRWPSSSQRLEV